MVRRSLIVLLFLMDAVVIGLFIHLARKVELNLINDLLAAAIVMGWIYIGQIMVCICGTWLSARLRKWAALGLFLGHGALSALALCFLDLRDIFSYTR